MTAQCKSTKRPAELSEIKRALLERQMQGRGAGGHHRQASIGPRPAGVPPLSFAQQRLWFLCQLEPNNASYNIPTALRIRGKLVVPVLERCLNEIIRRHEVLRARFAVVDDQPVQSIVPEMYLTVAVESLISLPESRREAEALVRARAEGQKLFDLERGPLLRAVLLDLGDMDGEREHVLLFTVHHIVSDGWSAGILFREFTALYEAFLAGKSSPLPELTIQYTDFAYWQRDWLRGDVLNRQIHYWTEQLRDLPALLELPTDHPRPSAQSYRGATHVFELTADLGAAVHRLAREQNVTVFVVLLAAFHVLLGRYSRQLDIGVGIPIAGRNRVEIEGLIGFFVNTLIIRGNLQGDPSFSELLLRVQERALGAQAHQDLPFEKLVEEIQPERDLSYSPMFQVMFVLHNVPRGEVAIPGIRVELLEVDYGSAKFDLILHATENGLGFDMALEYATDLFEWETIVRMAGHWTHLLRDSVFHPGRRISELALLGPEERETLLRRWNATAYTLPKVPGFPSLFEAQVRQTPGRIAVSCDNAALTYAGLNQRANRLAHALIREGVGPDSIVAILDRRGIDFLVMILAVLKAGGAYLPLDPDYPPGRLAQILEQSRASWVLAGTVAEGTARPLAESVAELKVLSTAEMLTADESEADPPVCYGPSNLAYVIYTSGSTGMPKGAMVHHAGLLNNVLSKINTLELTGDDVVAQTASHCFDISVWQFLTALACGACTRIVSDETVRDPAALLAAVDAGGISILEIVPTLMRALVEWEPLPALSALRWLIPTGEALPVDVCRSWMLRYPGTPLLNAYGPAECSDDVAYQRIETAPAEDDQLVPIGRPIANIRLYVLGPRLDLLPTGIPGELCVAGVGVGRGYLRDPGRTALSFVPDPFGTEPGGRLYRTGDLARYRPDGTLEFLGRLDHQVKLRGFRIELGEIEARFRQHPKVREAVAVVREERRAGKQLVAYLEVNGDVRDEEEFRHFLKENLPDYMIPSTFVFLEKLPLNANGKLDRKALPEPDSTILNERYTAPRTLTEHLLAGIWQDLLNVPRVGIRDNFFALGGDSILAIQIVSRANRAGVHLIPRQIFQHQTVAELAAAAETQAVIDAEQGPVTGDVPLTPVQHWFFDLDLVNAHHWNQSLLFKARRLLDAAVLRQASDELLAHHDMLRARFVRTATGWRQHCLGTGGDSVVSVVDLSMIRTPDLPGAIETEASRWQSSLNLCEGPLVRIVLMQPGQGREDRLLIVIHHLVIDGVSWRTLLEDLEAAYERIAAGQPANLPAKTASFKTWSERLLAYAGSDRLRDEFAYWLAETFTDFAPLPVDHFEGENTEASSHKLVVSLDEVNTRALLTEVPKAFRTQINEALLAALTPTLCIWTGGNSVAIDLEGHGREDLFDGLDTSRTLGWFTSVFPFALRVETETSGPVSLLLSLKNRLRGLPHRGIGYGLLRYLAQGKEVSGLVGRAAPRISFNYLGQLDASLPEEALLDLGDEPIGPHEDPRSVRPYELEIDCEIRKSRLVVVWRYSRARYLPETIQYLAEFYLEQLRSLIRACLARPEQNLASEDFPLAALSSAEFAGLPYPPSIIEDIYPLTPLQAGLLFHTLMLPGSGIYIMQDSFSLAGQIDVAVFQAAWQRVVDRHTILRTSIFWACAGQPHQIVHRKAVLPFEYFDWGGYGEQEQEARLAALREKELREGFDLGQPPLMRIRLIHFGADRYHCIRSYHHILMDAWCDSLILSDFKHCYYALLRAKSLPKAPSKSYRDYVAWLQRQDAAQAERFWRTYLEGFTEPTPLVVDCQEGAVLHGGEEVGDVATRLSAEDTAELHALARRHRLTPNTFAQVAWALLLARYSGRRDVLFGVTVAGRPGNLPGIEEVIGLFINTLPLRISVQPNWTVLHLLQVVLRQNLELRQYEYAPLVDIQAWSELPKGIPMFQHLFVFENAPVDSALIANTDDLSITEVLDRTHTNYPITVMAVPGECLHLQITYERARFKPEVAQRLVEHYRSVLEQMIRAPLARLGDLSLLMVAEQDRILSEWNRTDREFEGPGDFVARFKRQVALTPDRAAVSCGPVRSSYAELDQRSEHIAAGLCARGVGPETIVGLLEERGIDFLAMILGVFKAGAAYLPLEPDYPDGRILDIVHGSGAALLIVGATHRYRMEALFGVSSRPEIATCPELESVRPVSNGMGRGGDRNLAYIIYTSGSTGTPKGAMVERRGMLNNLLTKLPAMALTDADIIAQTASQCFDISVWQFLTALLCGAEVRIYPDEVARHPERLLRALAEDGVTILESVPSLIRAMLDFDGVALPRLRWLLPTGEAFPPEVCRLWMDRYPHVGLLNAYGPAECSDDVSYHQIGEVPDSGLASMPIGRPVDNMRIYLLDPWLNPVPVGVPGELCLAGIGVGRGYLGRPDLTAAAFLPNPFAEANGQRLYRTGDLARYRTDGVIEYLDRIDHQVKIRGFRIELGEIEARLHAHPEVREAAVVVREDLPGGKTLVAYVAANTNGVPDRTVLQAFLADSLPSYMVPAVFVFLDRLPLNRNGKIDRKALPAPCGENLPERRYTAPRNSTEAELAVVWQELLGISRIGMEDDFFELGGHSLLAIQLLFQIRKRFSVELPMRGIFDHPTLAAQAESIRHGGKVEDDEPVPDLEQEARLDLQFPAEAVTGSGTTPGSVFLTGANGFLGIHLLLETLEQTRAEVWCLVRAADPGQGWERLRTAAQQYGLDVNGYSERIHTVCGDLSKPFLGLTDQDFFTLAGRAEAIIHAGAILSDVQPYRALKPVNVGGTHEVLRLAGMGKAKPLHYISTVSIFGDALATDPHGFHESDFPVSTEELRDGYDQSKWVAEALVRQARERGLPVNIYRPSHIAGHSRSGAWNTSDFISRMIKGCIDLHVAPSEDYPVNLVPVDYVGRAVVSFLTSGEGLGQTLHLTHWQPLSSRFLFDWISANGYPLARRSYPEWAAAVCTAIKDSSAHPLYEFLPILEQEKSLSGALPEPQCFDCSTTRRILEGSGISCPAIDDALLRTYFSAFQASGFLSR